MTRQTLQGCWLFVMIAAGCSPGPGRPAVFPDASPRLDATEAPRPDAFVRDSGPPPVDAGFADARVGLPDATTPPAVRFDGVFGILDNTSLLFAREVDDRISLVVGQFPYVYTGTITDDGEVDAVSDVLVRSGCPNARITGTYDRVNAFHRLQHSSCTLQGQEFTTEIRGGFANNFDETRSGVYELQATVMDFGMCFGGDIGPYTVRYGISLVPGSASAAVFAAVDVIDARTVHIGSYSAADSSLTAIAQAFVQPGQFDTQIRGRFEQFSANEPVRFIGQRDVIDARTGCSFSLLLDGGRVSLP